MTPHSEQSITVAQRVVNHLIEIRMRPGMYIGVDAVAITHYLDGLHSGCELCGIEAPRHGYESLYMQVTMERGWEESSMDVVTRMSADGASYHAIVEEALLIELEIWRRMYGVVPTIHHNE